MPSEAGRLWWSIYTPSWHLSAPHRARADVGWAREMDVLVLLRIEMNIWASPVCRPCAGPSAIIMKLYFLQYDLPFRFNFVDKPFLKIPINWIYFPLYFHLMAQFVTFVALFSVYAVQLFADLLLSPPSPGPRARGNEDSASLVHCSLLRWNIRQMK